MELLNKDISFKSKFNNSNKFRFYNDLKVLLSSGIDIKTAFDIVYENFTKSKEKKIIDEIKNKVIKGDSLSEALESSKHFSPYEYFSIKIGEETGRITKVLENLEDFYKKKIDQRRKG